MTFPRLATAAQQRETVLGRAAEKPVDRIGEGWLLGHHAVEGVAFGVQLVVALRTPAELQAEEHVADAAPLHRGLQLLAVEVRRKARIGMGAHIHEIGDLVALHQSDERLEVVVGVPHGPHGGWRRHSFMLRPLPDGIGEILIRARAQSVGSYLA